MVTELTRTMHNSKCASDKSSLELELEKTNIRLQELQDNNQVETIEYVALQLEQEDIHAKLQTYNNSQIPQEKSSHPKLSKFGKVGGNMLLNTIITSAILAAGSFLIGYNLPPVADARAERQLEHYQSLRGTDYIALYDGDSTSVNMDYISSFFSEENPLILAPMNLNGNNQGIEHLITYFDELLYREIPPEMDSPAAGKILLDSEGTINEYLDPVEEARYEGIDLTDATFLLYVDRTSNSTTKYNVSIVPQESSSQLSPVLEEPSPFRYSINTRNIVELYDVLLTEKESGIYMLHTTQINDEEAPTAQIGFELEQIAIPEGDAATMSSQQTNLESDYLGVVLYHLDRFKPQIYQGTEESFINSVQLHIETNKLPITFSEELREKAMEYYSAVHQRNMGP